MADNACLNMNYQDNEVKPGSVKKAEHSCDVHELWTEFIVIYFKCHEALFHPFFLLKKHDFAFHFESSLHLVHCVNAANDEICSL